MGKVEKFNYDFTGSGGDKIKVSIWQPNTAAKLILHIVHGMTEHIDRYDALANYLAEFGIITIGMDLRGHGKNNNSSCASLGRDGYSRTLDDIEYINKKIKKHYDNVPLVMLGFSLGSFILRDYLSVGHKELSGAIIVGTASQPSAVLTMLKKVVSSQIKKYGFDSETKLVNQLSFETYNKKFAPNKTSADWLCSDVLEVEKYIKDDLCKDSISAGFFWQLLDAMQRTGDKTTYDKWNKKLPVLLLSGENDPVGNNGKGVISVQKAMEKSHIQDVRLELIPNSRHDVFHEYSNGGARITADIIKQFLLNFIN